MSKVLITYHTFSGKTKSFAEAAAEGVTSAGVDVVLKDAAGTLAQDVAAADAILVATPQPFKMLAGESMKLFERLWKDRAQIGEGKSLGVIVCYMNDATPTLEALKSLASHFKFTPQGDWVAASVKDLATGKNDCHRLGRQLAQAVKRA
ncbi:MAG: hypothetical protein HY671_00920 [Chloroflexi bacterium]|nr:hypothetical protein [Chloroflexota bacterium]